MKTFKYLLFLSIVTTFVIYSCKKEEVTDHPNTILALEGDYPPIISGNGIYNEDTIPSQTILGSARTNPYSVSVMKQAWNNLNPSFQISSLAPTNLYVKFSPNSVDDAKLLEATGEMLYDYPLLNQVITLGDYYPQPGHQFPELWAIVPPDFQSPISGYTVLSELFIPRYNTYLAEEAFRITNNEYNSEGDPMFIQNGNNIQSLVAPKNPDDGGDGGGGGGSGGGGSDPGLTTNSCGCIVYSDTRKPGGCIKVKETQFSGNAAWPGVRKVKVIMKDTWFTEDETWTDDNGCWKINDRYYHHAWMWIKFKGDMGQIRSNRGFGSNNPFAPLYEWLFPVKDYKGIVRNSPPYNNIEVKYDVWTNRGSSAHIHWGAATVNNAWYIFNEYASQVGINQAVPVDILLGRDHRGGYSLMSSKQTVANYGALVTSWAWLLGPWGVVIQTLGVGALYAYLPDVYIGIDFDKSDRLKHLSFHEIAHTSHFSKAGPFFWDNLVNAEIANFGHGNGSGPGSGQIALCESWADYIADNFTQRRYGGASSIGWQWGYLGEITRNETEHHIPHGLYNDLEDNIIDTDDACDEDWNNRCGSKCCSCCGPIDDLVTGFTTSQMFSLLGANTNSPSEFITKLKIQFLPLTGNTEMQVDNLVNSY